MKDKPRNGRKFPRFPGPAAQAWLRDERSTDLVHRDKQSMTRYLQSLGLHAPASENTSAVLYAVQPFDHCFDFFFPPEARKFDLVRFIPTAQDLRPRGKRPECHKHEGAPTEGVIRRGIGTCFLEPAYPATYAAPAPVTGLGRSVSAQPVSSLRPQPPAHAQPQSPGYTDDQLHPSVVFPRSAGAVTPNSTLAMEGRSRLESTLTATSVGTGAGTAGGRSTLKGKKLLKKSGQPQGAGQEGAGSTLGRGTVKGTVGKRHWWNRRRSEVEGVAAVL